MEKIIKIYNFQQKYEISRLTCLDIFHYLYLHAIVRSSLEHEINHTIMTMFRLVFLIVIFISAPQCLPCLSKSVQLNAIRGGANTPGSSLQHENETNSSTNPNQESNSTRTFSQVDLNKHRVLTYYGLMLSGAMARSASATIAHPLNVLKTILQMRDYRMPTMTWRVLSRGVCTQFIMSIPHGALNYVTVEAVKVEIGKAAIDMELSFLIPKTVLDPFLDFLSSAISTFVCSLVSTPQMVITDNIMAGKYANFYQAVWTIATTEGCSGFYRGWSVALLQKIPSYALTWVR